MKRIIFSTDYPEIIKLYKFWLDKKTKLKNKIFDKLKGK